MENNIKFYRTYNGMSQSELGQKLNVTGATISSWEMGRTEPNWEQSMRMARIFGCALEELFNRGEKHTDSLSSEEKQIIETYRKSDSQTREMVKRILAYAKEILNEEHDSYFQFPGGDEE